MTIQDDEYDESEVEDTTMTDHDYAEEHPPTPKQKKSKKKKKHSSKKHLTTDDGEGDEEIAVKPKKKRSKKKVVEEEHQSDDDDDSDEDSDDEEAPKPNKKKSVKKKKSKKSIVDIESQMTIPTDISTVGLSRQSNFERSKSSTLASSDDPFAAREGKTLLWRNVNMSLVSAERSQPVT